MLDVSKLNKEVPIPLYFQLKELILAEIMAGNYQVGDAIPTEKELSEMFQISRTTVRQAISDLEHKGWLVRMKSKGTFVSKPKFHQNFTNALESFNDQIEKSGRVPSTIILDFEVVLPPEDIALHLQLKTGEKAIYIHRKRCADGEPIVTTKSYLPYEKCSFVMEHNLETESLYPILAMKESTKIYKIERLIEAVEATATDMKYLEIKRGKAIQQFISKGFNASDEVIEYSISRYRGDRNTFETILLRNE
ncbi:MAG: GntR family transcriptional regulator [Lachnospiraceae bacterium]|nr:GntR family transcriptional regulator [Lachnospiraceae bacterium]MDD3659809.1 GntR family transcriptional regulator [Lachnospiraceae bacterium]